MSAKRFTRDHTWAAPSVKIISARHVWHVRASVLACRRTSLACPRTSAPLHVGGQVLRFSESVLACRRLSLQLSRSSFSTSARQFCHFGALVLALRRVGFCTSSGVLFWHVGRHLQHGDARSLGMSARLMTCRRVASLSPCCQFHLGESIQGNFLLSRRCLNLISMLNSDANRRWPLWLARRR